MAKTKEKKEKIRLTDLTTTELEAKAKQMKADLLKKQMDKAVGRLKNVRELFNLRKEIARIKTIHNIKRKLNSVKS